jgi:hypothetical protein
MSATAAYADIGIKLHYADVIVMPILVVAPLVVGVNGLLRSA